jgi:hypothetical protein
MILSAQLQGMNYPSRYGSGHQPSLKLRLAKEGTWLKTLTPHPAPCT